MKKLFTITAVFLLMIIGLPNSVPEKPPYILQDEIKINDDDNSSRGVPHIAVYEDNVYITWFDNRDNTNGISDTYFAKSTDTGGNFSANKKIGDQTGYLEIVAGPTGNIYGIFASYGNISFMKSTDDGETFSEPIKVNDEASNGQCMFPEIAVDGEDNIYVVWEDHRNEPLPGVYNPDIYFSRSTDGGESFGPNIRINDDISLSAQTDPEIATGKDCEVYVVWADARNDQNGSLNGIDWDIYFAKSINKGESFSDNIMVNDDPTYSAQTCPNIATDCSGNIYVVWADQRPGPGDESGNYKIYLSKSTNRGFSFGPDIFIKGGPGGADIVADDKGVYITYVFGNGYLVYSEDGDNFSEPMCITLEECVPRIALDSQSNIYLVWGDIYFKKGIRTEPTNENGDGVQNNHQDGIYQWLWILVAVIIIICVAYLVKRKHSKKQE